MKMRFFSLLIAVLICGLTVFSAAASAADVDIDETSVDYEMLNVPQIRITTEEGNGTSLQKADGYVNASVTITDTDGSVLEDSAEFKVRGNTTAMTTVLKKAYTFKFAKKKNVLGLGSGKKWALLADAFDPTLLRNAIANNIAHELSLPYTSNRRYAELWVDNSYRGCYEVFEPVQEGKDRVNIDIESNDGMKDFLIEYEAKRVEDDVTYFTVSGLRFISSEPEEPNEDQLNYITSTMADIITTLKTGTREEIEEKIDVDSFAKYYILNEYVKTFDFDMSSVFFFYQDDKLYAGPAWDYDLSAGNVNDALTNKRYKEATPTNGLYCNKKNIYTYLCDKEWFMDEAKNVYREHYDFFCDICADGGMMDRLYQENAAIFDRNYASGNWRTNKWWINIQKQPLATYQENYDYLKNWITERNLWLTDYFEINEVSFILGDADGDGEVTSVDTACIQRFIAHLGVPESFSEGLSDVDGDEKLTSIDVTFIQRYLSEMNVPYAIGEPIA